VFLSEEWSTSKTRTQFQLSNSSIAKCRKLMKRPVTITVVKLRFLKMNLGLAEAGVNQVGHRWSRQCGRPPRGEAADTERAFGFVAAAAAASESPELSLARRMVAVLPPFAPSSSRRVTNERCLKESRHFVQELDNLAMWALRSEYRSGRCHACRLFTPTRKLNSVA
jgi:hypothetical protein